MRNLKRNSRRYRTPTVKELFDNILNFFPWKGTVRRVKPTLSTDGTIAKLERDYDMYIKIANAKTDPKIAKYWRRKAFKTKFKIEDLKQ